MTVEPKKRTATEEVVGTVRARLHATIEAKISSRISQMLALPGQSVRAEEVLIRLESRETQARLDQAQAQRDHAQQDLDRLTPLLARGAVTPHEFDAAKARARIADAAVAEAKTLLDYSTIRAPFPGVVTRKFADVGDLASPGKPLAEIEDPTSLRLEANVSESLIGRVQGGAHLPVRVHALDRDLIGTVSEVAPAADPGSRTFLVKLDLPATTGLRVGMFGRVSVPVGESTALRAPSAAVVLRGQLEIVFVLKNDRAELRLVRTGKRVGDEIELLSGVSAGETIVVDGAAELEDGQPVKRLE